MWKQPQIMKIPKKTMKRKTKNLIDIKCTELILLLFKFVGLRTRIMEKCAKCLSCLHILSWSFWMIWLFTQQLKQKKNNEFGRQLNTGEWKIWYWWVLVRVFRARFWALLLFFYFSSFVCGLELGPPIPDTLNTSISHCGSTLHCMM